MMRAVDFDNARPSHLNDSAFRHQVRAVEMLGFEVCSADGSPFDTAAAPMNPPVDQATYDAARTIVDFINANDIEDVVICYARSGVGEGHTFAADGRTFFDNNTGGRVVGAAEIHPDVRGMKVIRVVRVRRSGTTSDLISDLGDDRHGDLKLSSGPIMPGDNISILPQEIANFLLGQVTHSVERTIGHHCVSIPEGWSWTLSSMLGRLVDELENRYGPRDHTWLCLGVDFGGVRPGIWYPGNRSHLIIKLSESARCDRGQAAFQLSHEAVHLLSPSGSQNGLVIEEGLATLFSEEVSRRLLINLVYGDPSYRYAAEKVATFLNIYPDGIRTLRTIEQKFFRFTPALIRSVFPNISDQLAIELCEPFSDVEKRFQSLGH